MPWISGGLPIEPLAQQGMPLLKWKPAAQKNKYNHLYLT